MYWFGILKGRLIGMSMSCLVLIQEKKKKKKKVTSGFGFE